MDDFKNIQVYSDVHGILSIDGMSMGETSSPLCFLLPPRRALISFSPLCRAETGFYLGFSRMAELSGEVPRITEDDGMIRVTAARDTLIADICPPFLPEQPWPPHVLASAASGRCKAMIYWDRWITFAIENERGEILYARPMAAERMHPEAARAEVFFRNCGGSTIAFGAYRMQKKVSTVCATAAGKELFFKECSAYSFGDRLTLKYEHGDEFSSVYTEVLSVNERGVRREDISGTRKNAEITPAAAMHALALAVEHGCEKAAAELLAPGLRAHLYMARLKEFFGEVCGVERRLCGNDGVILKYPAGNFVFEGRCARAELTGGLISNITMD